MKTQITLNDSNVLFKSNMDISVIPNYDVLDVDFNIIFDVLPEGGYMFTFYTTGGSFLQAFLWIDVNHNIELFQTIGARSIEESSNTNNTVYVKLTNQSFNTARFKLLSLRKI
jgi:hypothetical protein